MYLRDTQNYSEAQRTGAKASAGQTGKEGAPKLRASTVDSNDADKEGKESKVSATPMARKVTFVAPIENAVSNQPAVMTSELGSPDANDRTIQAAEAIRAARSKRARAKPKERK